MATQYWGISKGENAKNVDTGTSTTSNVVEISWNKATALTKGEFRQLVQEIVDAAVESGYFNG